jgi:hypothetical protein
LLGGFSALFLITTLRWILLKWQFVEDDDETRKHQRTLIVGEEKEYNQAQHLLREAGLQHRILGRVSVNENTNDSIGSVDQLDTLVESIGVRELIFCQGYLSYKTIIDLIQQLPSDISTRFFSTNSNSIVGSDSKDTSGQSVSEEVTYNLSAPYQRRMKKIVDLFFAILILLTFPIHLILLGVASIKNAVKVLTGRRTWVGYAATNAKLPHIAPGVLSTSGKSFNTGSTSDQSSLKKIDFWYAKNYDWTRDLKIIIKHYRHLGNQQIPVK